MTHCMLHTVYYTHTIYYENHMTVTLYKVNATNCEYSRLQTMILVNSVNCYLCSTWYAEVPSSVIY